MEQLWPDRERWEPSKQCRTRLAAARRHRGIKQEKMAAALGIGLATYRRLEANQTRNPALTVLVNCALILEVPLTSIIEDDWAQWREITEETPAEMPDRSGLWRSSGRGWQARPQLPPG